MTTNDMTTDRTAEDAETFARLIELNEHRIATYGLLSRVFRV